MSSRSIISSFSSIYFRRQARLCSNLANSNDRGQFHNDEDENSNGGDRDRRFEALKVTAGVVLASASIFGIHYFRNEIENFVRAKTRVVAAKKTTTKKTPENPTKPGLTTRELRFLSFASIEYEGQIFMTPRDVLDSVTQLQPTSRRKRRELSNQEVKKILKKTPAFKNGSKTFFRELNENGLISYTEYLFLLCVLTKPTSGFRIAFNMFDTDGNQKVDKKEFLVIQALTLLLRAGGKIAEFDPYLDSVPGNMLNLVKDTNLNLRKEYKELLDQDGNIDDLETVFASSRRQKRELQLRQYEEQINGKDETNGDESGDSDDEMAAIDPKPQESIGDSTEQKSMWDKTAAIMETMRVQDTTLLMHFFGKRGNQTLSYDDFHKFMDNLQTEVLEIEFMEYARGKPTISETDFAKILLRYTVSKPDDYKAYMDRVRERIPDVKGITFDQFRQFCQFLTCLDDFSIAVKLYTFADSPASQAEFARAVKVSTGCALDAHIVDTVYQIFDVNQDGRLSYTEFICVMRDRLNRGFRTHLVERHGWEAFKHCIRAEMKRY